jgi:hypothetical protein
MLYCRHFFSRGHISIARCLTVAHGISSSVPNAVSTRHRIILPTVPSLLLPFERDQSTSASDTSLQPADKAPTPANVEASMENAISTSRRTVQPNVASLLPPSGRDESASSSNLDTSLQSADQTSTPVDEVALMMKITPYSYKQLRDHDRNLVSNLPKISYLRVLDKSMAKSPDLANCVVKDIMEIYRGEHSDQIDMLRAILSRDFSALKPDIILSILQRFQDIPKKFHYLSSSSVVRLARLVMSISTWNESEIQLLQLIYRLLRVRAGRYKVPSGERSLDYHPPQIIHATFGIVHKLMHLSLQHEALHLIQKLVTTGHIPPETIQGLDSSCNDFRVMVGTALTRASLHWNWKPLAVAVVTDLLDLSSPPHPSITDLSLDAIHALLDSPSLKDIRACKHLIITTHPLSPVPDSVIRQFYTSAAQLLAGDDAEGLYTFTRSPSTLREHNYPPPHGPALSWLMYHLTAYSRKSYLSRILASEVVEHHLPLPLQTRARFLANTAAQGYAQLARKLWERYSVGKDNHVIIGSSQLMIRMVSLFAYLRRRVETPRESLKPRLMDEERLGRQSEDITSFLTQVLQSYRAHYKPLVRAPHTALTSLARACFIVGRYSEGLETFKILLHRQEIPDIYDINVAFTAVAELKPRLAAGMIERMIERGLEPDAVTFGTIMHHALLHEDTALVNKMKERIQSLDNTRLSLKSIAGFVRASVASGGDASLTFRLRDVLTMIESLRKTKPVSSPQTGKYLVSTCLRIGDPVLAYKFWDLLLRESAEWSDTEHQRLRRGIAQLIEQHDIELNNDRILSSLRN